MGISHTPHTYPIKSGLLYVLLFVYHSLCRTRSYPTRRERVEVGPVKKKCHDYASGHGVHNGIGDARSVHEKCYAQILCGKMQENTDSPLEG